jgi:enterochelin esterase family protein
MHRHPAIRVAVLLCAALVAASWASSQTTPRKPGEYPLTPDSLPQDGVPKGRLEGPFEFRSQIIANTVRQYWIYVPAQYTGETPANVLVFQDGARAINPAGSLRVPQVLENLVHRKDIPVTIGIFITPGQRGDVFPADVGTGNPNNRAQEYDAVDDTYARFLIDELLPHAHAVRSAARAAAPSARSRSRGTGPTRSATSSAASAATSPSATGQRPPTSRRSRVARSTRRGFDGRRSSRSASSCRTGRTIWTTTGATGSSRTSRC